MAYQRVSPILTISGNTVDSLMEAIFLDFNHTDNYETWKRVCSWKYHGITGMLSYSQVRHEYVLTYQIMGGERQRVTFLGATPMNIREILREWLEAGQYDIARQVSEVIWDTNRKIDELESGWKTNPNSTERRLAALAKLSE